MQKPVLDNKELSTKKTYLRYTRNMRVELIRLVTEQNLPTAQAARLVGIKQTSACRIIASFRNHNRIFERKADRLSRETIQNSYQTQKIDGNHEKMQLKPSENVKNQTLMTGSQSKFVQNQCDQKIGVLVGDGSSNQFLIPNTLPIPIDVNSKNSWTVWSIGTNAMWNWPFVYPIL